MIALCHLCDRRNLSFYLKTCSSCTYTPFYRYGGKVWILRQLGTRWSYLLSLCGCLASWLCIYSWSVIDGDCSSEDLGSELKERCRLICLGYRYISRLPCICHKQSEKKKSVTIAQSELLLSTMSTKSHLASRRCSYYHFGWFFSLKFNRKEYFYVYMPILNCRWRQEWVCVSIYGKWTKTLDSDEDAVWICSATFYLLHQCYVFFNPWIRYFLLVFKSL